MDPLATYMHDHFASSRAVSSEAGSTSKGMMETSFRLMHISVDGSLANPHMRIAVAIWAVLLTLLTAWLVVGGQGRSSKTIAALGLLVLGLSALTPFAQLQLAWICQAVEAKEMISTTFFSPPPGWLAPLISNAGGLVLGGTVRFVRRRRMQAISPTGVS